MTGVRDTSLLALDKSATQRITLKGRVAQMLRWHCEPSTRAELASMLGVRINCICYPVLSMIQSGVLEELPARRDRETGYMAHPVWFTPTNRELDV